MGRPRHTSNEAQAPKPGSSDKGELEPRRGRADGLAGRSQASRQTNQGMGMGARSGGVEGQSNRRSKSRSGCLKDLGATSCECPAAKRSCTLPYQIWNACSLHGEMNQREMLHVIVIASKILSVALNVFPRPPRARKLCIIFILSSGGRTERAALFFARSEPNCKFMMAVTKIYSVLLTHRGRARDAAGASSAAGDSDFLHHLLLLLLLLRQLRRRLHGCQMAIAIFLDSMCLALWA